MSKSLAHKSCFTDKGNRAERLNLFLRPLVGNVRHRQAVTFDFESKDGDTQKRGFSRPFLVIFDDGGTFPYIFRNSNSVADLPWRERHLAPGGLVDAFLHFLFGINANEEAKKKYQSDKCYIFSHNGGKFDILFLLPWLIRHRESFSFEITSVQSKIQRLDVWPRGETRNHNTWTFLDSVSLLPMTLEAMGKTFSGDPANQNAVGLRQKGKIGKAFSKPSPFYALFGENKTKKKINLNLNEHDRYWETYCAADCRVLLLSLQKYFSLIEGLGGEVGITSPATAMKLWRRRYQNRNWVVINKHFKDCKNVCFGECKRSTCSKECHGCAHEWIRRGYFGGRTELFREWGKGLHYYDINSSYPASMLEDMPCGKMFEFLSSGNLKHDLLRIDKLAKTHIGFIECEVFVPKECDIPPLPHRNKDTGKLEFAAGYFVGVWSWAELQLLHHKRVQGKITRVIKTVWYEKKPLFRDMVLDLYSYRQKHLPGCKDKKCKTCMPGYDVGLDQVCKLMLNSLYGKFGMSELRTGLIMRAEGDPFPADATPLFGNHDDDYIWEVEKIVEAPYIVPQIASYITALSRIRLFLGMMAVKDAHGAMCPAGAKLHPDIMPKAFSKPSRVSDRLLTGLGGKHPRTPRINAKSLGSEVFGLANEPQDDTLGWHESAKGLRWQKPPKRVHTPQPQEFGECGGCGEVLYIDTDSILCDVQIRSGSNLGEWKEEEPGMLLEGEFILPKLYRLIAHQMGCEDSECKGCFMQWHLETCKDKKKCKGCSPTKQRMKGVGNRIQTSKNFDLMVHDGGTLRFQRVSQHKSILRKGMLVPEVVKTKKSLRTKYDKRNLHEDGSTTPHYHGV